MYSSTRPVVHSAGIRPYCESREKFPQKQKHFGVTHAGDTGRWSAPNEELFSFFSLVLDFLHITKNRSLVCSAICFKTQPISIRSALHS